MVELSQFDREQLSGKAGKANQLAMELIVKAAEISQANCLIDVSSAHVNSCFYTGQVGLDFAEYLVEHGGRISVPTTTNVGLIDLLHPELRPEKSNQKSVRGAKRLMDLYAILGCDVVWTCAPYQLKERPKFADQVVGSESNAVTFYNSVLGARTNKYGDFLDISAAITGRVPLAGLHKDEKRKGEVLFQLERIPEALKQQDIFYHVLGILIGQLAGTQIPVINGLPILTNEDQLKAISAAAATSGSVSLFHAVGITPEAPDIETVFQNQSPDKIIKVTPEMLIRTRDSLNIDGANQLGAVCLGTPHFSITECEQLVPLIEGKKVHSSINFFLSMSRFVENQAKKKGWIETFKKAGIKIVLDTCTYYTPTVNGIQGRVMTNSAKWAYYAPGLLELSVAFGSMEECVESAVKGTIYRDSALWSNQYWGEG